MKKKHIIITASLTALMLVLMAGCKKGVAGPSIDDYFLNYPINEIPVTDNYNVGAFYYSFNTFNANIMEVPVVGKYTIPNGAIDPAIMSKHIDYAVQAGIDYFLFPQTSYNKDHSNFVNDSVLISRFLAANTSDKMHFAVTYTFNPSSYAVTTTSPLEKDSVKLNQFFQDIEKLAPFFQNSSYEKVDGKALLYIANANQMYSNDNPSIYKTMRARLSAMGVELYIVGMQERWSPPGRYPFRFKDCVDAIYFQSLSAQLNNWDRWYLLPQAMDQNWEYARAYFKDSMNVSFVPDISPAYNWNILQPASTNPNYPRTDSGKLYRTLCNVAKMNADNSTRLILIDSWNDWQEDMQLEPAESYGDLYLDITKQEFKK